ncbi:MAG: hypothetical protein ACI9UA_005289 [Pseudoalteromonas tetraodonis]|jgi:hypothetical protein
MQPHLQGVIAANNMKLSVTIVDRGAVYAEQMPEESANAPSARVEEVGG